MRRHIYNHFSAAGGLVSLPTSENDRVCGSVVALMLLGLVVLVVLTGCASLPATVDRPPSMTLVAPAGAPLAAVAHDAGVPAGLSGFRPLLQSTFALDTRLELIRRAQVSLDVQYYLIGNDSIGRMILRELRDASQRGVRVRLLLDDLHTERMDELLLGLSAHPKAEVRLFNPFAYGRDALLSRYWQLATDFGRLNHRMHNKLLVADGAVSIVGGRNLADDYFLRNDDANFIDFDLLMAGAIVPQLSATFDAYWNSGQVFPVEAITRNDTSAEQRRRRFDDLVDAKDAPAPDKLLAVDLQGRLPFGAELDAHRHQFVIASGGVMADRPDKLFAGDLDPPPTVADRYQSLLGEARTEIIVVSPYFIPGEAGVQRLRQVRERGVDVRIVTNASSSTDVALVSISSARYRTELLGLGVKLFEFESVRLMRAAKLHALFRRSRGRLHAKVGIIDREVLLVGSMNVDPRSARINTEIGVAVRSSELARQVLPSYDLATIPGLYEVRLKAVGSGIEWVDRDDDGNEERLDAAPGVSWLDSLRLFLLSGLVLEDQL